MSFKKKLSNKKKTIDFKKSLTNSTNPVRSTYVQEEKKNKHDRKKIKLDLKKEYWFGYTLFIRKNSFK